MTIINSTLTDAYEEPPARLPIYLPPQENTMARQSKNQTSKIIRRGHHEGSIQRTENGKYRIWATCPNGQRKSRTFASRTDALAWSREIRATKTSPQATKLTLEKYLESWFEIHQLQLKDTTKADYIRLIQKRINPHIGSIKLIDLKPSTFDRLYYDLHLEGVGDSQIRYAQRVVHKAMEDAVRDMLIPTNPAHGAKVPKKNKRPVDIPLNQEQSIKLAEVAMTTSIGPLISMALKTGMRQGELLALKWSDIDFSTGQLHVQRNLQRFSRSGKLILQFSTPKSESSNRTFLIGKDTLEILELQRQQVELMKRVAKGRWKEDDLVFPSSVGTPMNQSNLLKRFAEVLKLAHLPHIRFHDLRHIAASMMLNNGVPELTVSHILGHSVPSTTMNMYGHRDPTVEYQVACLMDQIFESARPIKLPEGFVTAKPSKAV